MAFASIIPLTRRVMLQSRATEFLKAARTSLPVSADPNTFCSQLVLVGVLRVQLNAKSCQVMQSHAKSLLNNSAAGFSLLLLIVVVALCCW